MAKRHWDLELRSSGADSERFPELATFAWKFGEMAERHVNVTHARASHTVNASRHHPLDRFLVALDLKGALADNGTVAREIFSNVRRLTPALPPPIMWYMGSKTTPATTGVGDAPWMLALRDVVPGMTPDEAESMAAAAALAAPAKGFAALGVSVNV